MGLKYADDFCEIGSTGLWASHDPRLKASPIAQSIPLDRPPYTPDVNTSEMYSDDLINYGKGYKTYEDIQSGNVQYYRSKHLSDIYHEPTFIIKSRVTNSTFKDPMGGIHTQFNRQPILKDNKHISDYSFDRDQMSFREDMMATKVGQLNKNNWNKMWGKVQN